jgi:hypothetical protein
VPFVIINLALHQNASATKKMFSKKFLSEFEIKLVNGKVAQVTTVYLIRE